jgi:membrane protease YdiL (CAAX protease family)
VVLLAGTVLAGAVLAGCAGTAAAGVLFTVLRQRSGSLLAPVLLHLAANSLGLLAAAGAHRLRARQAHVGLRGGEWRRCSLTT